MSEGVESEYVSLSEGNVSDSADSTAAEGRQSTAPVQMRLRNPPIPSAEPAQNVSQRSFAQSADGEDLITINIIHAAAQVGTVPYRVPQSARVADLKIQLYARELEERKHVILIFRGRRLEDSRTLADHGISDNDYVHCQITRAPSPFSAEPPAYAPAATQRQRFVDASPFILFFFVTMALGVCWTAYVQNRERLPTYVFFGLLFLTGMLVVGVHSLTRQ